MNTLPEQRLDRLLSVAVVGSTGNNASSWSRELDAAGFEVTQLVRNPDRQPKDSLSQRRLDLDDPSGFRSALQGIEVLGLATPAAPGQVQRELALIAAAVDTGVERIVKLSVSGADLERPVSPFARWAAAIEAELRETGVASVILRPNFYMQNLLRQKETIAAGRYVDSVGGRRITWIDVADIARVAAVVAGGGYDGETLELTGPEPVGAQDIARALTEVTGHEVEAVSVTPTQLHDALLAQGLPEFVADAQRELLEAIESGQASHFEIATDAVERVTGTAPRTFAEFAVETFATR